ncbi:L-2-hydroxyglutarate dehydrogenase, mitochondrial [Lamellibrachia satsuma]|nr:L-2-hydroxyglutarate dehydrogenase, mitochondrial [Lamellibrachia satsuma]
MSVCRVLYSLYTPDLAVRHVLCSLYTPDLAVRHMLCSLYTPDLAVRHVLCNLYKPDLAVGHVLHSLYTPDLAVRHVLCSLYTPDLAVRHVLYSLYKPDLAVRHVLYSLYMPDLAIRHMLYSLYTPDLAVRHVLYSLYKPDLAIRHVLYSLYMPDLAIRHMLYSLYTPDLAVRHVLYSLYMPDLAVSHVLYSLYTPDLAVRHVLYSLYTPDLAVRHVLYSLYKPDLAVRHVLHSLYTPDLAIRHVLCSLYPPDLAVRHVLYSLYKPDLDVRHVLYSLYTPGLAVRHVLYSLYIPAMVLSLFQALRALHSPHTGIVDYEVVTQSFARTYKHKGGKIHMGFKVTGFSESTNCPDYPVTIEGTNTNVFFDSRSVRAKYVITCGGLHSDRLAKFSGCSSNPKIVPFRGEYLKLKDGLSDLVHTNIYPVPDPNLPFLGVHFTPRMNGDVWLGPNALLAFKREGYRFRDFSPTDFADSITFPHTFLKHQNVITNASMRVVNNVVCEFTQIVRHVYKKLDPSIDESGVMDLMTQLPFQQALANGEEPGSHQDKVGTPLTKEVAEQVKEVYVRLDPELLHRCVLGKTQNANETLHSKVWRKCPKTGFVGLMRIVSATCLAIAEFNQGVVSTVTRSYDIMGISGGSRLRISAAKADSRRQQQSVQQVQEAVLREKWLGQSGLRKLVFSNFTYAADQLYCSFFLTAQVKQLQRFIPKLKVSDVEFGKAGVRAQALSPDGKLVDDFVFDKGTGHIGSRMLHVRNAPSPAATSSLAIAKMVADKAKEMFHL